MSKNKKNYKTPDDFSIYCKATNERNFYWIAYDSYGNVIAKDSGFGKHKSIIHATLVAILDALQQTKIETANKKVGVLTDIQWIAENLNHGSFYSDHLVQIVSDIRTLECECSHVSIRWCPKLELVERIPFAKAIWEAKQKERDFVDHRFVRSKEALRNGESVNYHQYLFSDEWRIKANQCKEQAGYRCRLCNRGPGDVALVAHHRTYVRLGNELPDDLTCLCKDCHELFERNSSHRPSKSAYKIAAPSDDTPRAA